MSGAALSGKRVKRKEIKEIVDALLRLGFKDIVKD